MTAVSAPSDSRGTFESSYGLVGLSQSVRALDVEMLAPWEDVPHGMIGRSPAAALRNDINRGDKKPNQHILRMVYGLIDCGIHWEKATAWLDTVKRMAKGYWERKQGRTTGVRVLPFPVLFERVFLRETREQAEADMSCIRVDLSDPTSIRAAEVEIQDHIDALKVKLELLQDERTKLETKAGA